jgi:hypothetical protein
MYRSAFYGYPDWTPAGEVVGYPWDAGLTIDCGLPTAVQKGTWGEVKSLFR